MLKLHLTKLLGLEEGQGQDRGTTQEQLEQHFQQAEYDTEDLADMGKAAATLRVLRQSNRGKNVYREMWKKRRS
eukprot:3108464-Ditylum_brightwellii.AAC.1